MAHNVCGPSVRLPHCLAALSPPQRNHPSKPRPGQDSLLPPLPPPPNPDKALPATPQRPDKLQKPLHISPCPPPQAFIQATRRRTITELLSLPHQSRSVPSPQGDPVQHLQEILPNPRQCCRCPHPLPRRDGIPLLRLPRPHSNPDGQPRYLPRMRHLSCPEPLRLRPLHSRRCQGM